MKMSGFANLAWYIVWS